MCALIARLFIVLVTSFILNRLPAAAPVEDKMFWYNKGKDQLKQNKNLHNVKEFGDAENVILFLGDGMGSSTVTAARLYQNTLQKKSLGDLFHFEEFPFTGRAKIYSVDHQVSDSAASATAILTGSKTRQGVIGFDCTIKDDSCDDKIYEKSRLSSIADWAIKSHKWVGLITNTRITDNIPAALYAHIPNKDWVCNNIPPNMKKCFKDIPNQLIQTYPGKEIKIYLGGGRDVMGVSKSDYCKRDKDLVEAWKKSKKRMNSVYVSNTKELKNVNKKTTDFLLGLFSEGNMPYDLERDETPEGQPSLTEMTEKALEILSRNKKGYLLLVVNGLINCAHNMNAVKLALAETIQLNEAVKFATENTRRDKTLIIVSSDISQGLGVYGYAERETSLLGKAGQDPWPILFYGVGPGAHNDTLCDTDPTSTRYRTSAFYFSKTSVHTADDVNVYARGPGGRLLIGIYEQSYVAHVISYAAAISDHTCRLSPYHSSLLAYCCWHILSNFIIKCI
ncbi:Alkaline phosphatase 4 [Blattella germanica]|nr:Alkaline phosphatase 4 [Blattella germanica]